MKYAKLCTLKLLYDPKEKFFFFKSLRHNNVRIVNELIHKITHKQLFIIYPFLFLHVYVIYVYIYIIVIKEIIHMKFNTYISYSLCPKKIYITYL